MDGDGNVLAKGIATAEATFTVAEINADNAADYILSGSPYIEGCQVYDEISGKSVVGSMAMISGADAIKIVLSIDEGVDCSDEGIMFFPSLTKASDEAIATNAATGETVHSGDVLTTDAKGEINLNGLNKLTTNYYVKEIKAPLGYAVNGTLFTLFVDDRGKIENEIDYVMTVYNDHAITLFTGGTGRMMIYIIGGLMLVVLGGLWAARRRKGIDRKNP